MTDGRIICEFKRAMYLAGNDDKEFLDLRPNNTYTVLAAWFNKTDDEGQYIITLACSPSPVLLILLHSVSSTSQRYYKSRMSPSLEKSKMSCLCYIYDCWKNLSPSCPCCMLVKDVAAFLRNSFQPFQLCLGGGGWCESCYRFKQYLCNE